MFQYCGCTAIVLTVIYVRVLYYIYMYIYIYIYYILYLFYIAKTTCMKSWIGIHITAF